MADRRPRESIHDSTPLALPLDRPYGAGSNDARPTENKRTRRPDARDEGRSMIARPSRRALFIAIAGVLALTGAVFAQAPPTPWTAPAADKAKKSPLPPSPKAVADGKTVAQVNW